MRRFVRLGFVGWLFVLVLSGCARRPPVMDHEVFLHTVIGHGAGQVGSNYEMLTNAGIRDGLKIKDLLDISTSFQIVGRKVYIADKYRRAILVLTPGEFGRAVTYMEIPNVGDGYAFDTVYQVAVNKYGEIYAMVSALDTDVQVREGYDPIEYRYFIYKFSHDGRFLFSIGLRGMNTEPMPAPDFIDLDLFGNIYAYFREIHYGELHWRVRRYSSSGELNFEFDSQYLARKQEIDGEVYNSTLQGIVNLKNDERLIFFTANHLFQETPERGKEMVSHRSVFEVYSILKNTITRQLIDERSRLKDVLAVTWDDTIILYGYDAKHNVVRFHFFDMFNNRHSYQYAPVLSDHYMHFGFYGAPNGELYSLVVTDDKQFVILHWQKRSRTRFFE